MDGLSLFLDLFLSLFLRMCFMRPVATDCGQLSEETSVTFLFKIIWGSYNLMHFAARLFPVFQIFRQVSNSMSLCFCPTRGLCLETFIIASCKDE